MSEIESHWHGLSCFEIKICRPLEPGLFRQLGNAARRLRESGIVDSAVSSYGSIATYWSLAPKAASIAEQITEIVLQSLETPLGELVEHSQTHWIDVVYDGVDLDELAESCGLSSREVVRRHMAAEYVVAAVGFMPHFAYLWGLDPSIAAIRKSSPRVRVPLGSLGIAGEQTGIYPTESPGGWQLIGNVCPSVCRKVCPQLKIGDVVRFQEAPS